MRCYTHADIPALGICCVCGRGLCQACLVEVKGNCCCKGRCETAVKTPEEREAEIRNHPSFRKTREMIETFTRQTLGIAYLMPGLLLVSIGITLKLPPLAAGVVAYILLAAGAMLLVWYYYLLVKKKREAKA